mgnify:CR=1 FL=1
MRHALTASALASMLAFAGVARAEVGDDPLAEARTQLEAMEYEEAAATIQDVIEGGDLLPEQLARAYQGLAQCAAALRRPDEAQAAFVRLLAIDPDFYVATDESPLVREPFEAATRFWRGEERPSVSYTPEAELGQDEPLVVEPEISRGPISGFPAELTLHLLAPGGRYVAYLGEGDRVTVAPADLEGLEVAAFYLALRDEHGNALAMEGSSEAPLEVELAGGRAGGGGGGGDIQGPTRPLYEQWWLWTIVGVVVVGLAVGLPVGLTAGSGEGPCERAFNGPCDLAASFGE